MNMNTKMMAKRTLVWVLYEVCLSQTSTGRERKRSSLVAKQSCSHATNHHIDGNTQGDQEACLGAHQYGGTSSVKATYSNSVHASQCIHRGRSSKDQHGRHDDVRGQAEEHEDQMSDSAPSSGNDLEPCVRVRSIQLKLRGKLCRDGDTMVRPSHG